MSTRLLASRVLHRYIASSQCLISVRVSSYIRSTARGYGATQQLHVTSKTVQPRLIWTRLAVGPAKLAAVAGRRVMASSVSLQERDVRQVIFSAIQSALAVPQHNWSEEFVIESVLGELIISSNSSNITGSHQDPDVVGSDSSESSSNDDATVASTGSSDAPSVRSSKRLSRNNKKSSSNAKNNKKSAAENAGSASADIEVSFAPDIAEALDAFAAAKDTAEITSQATAHASSTSSSRLRRSSSEEDDGQQQQQQQQQDVLEDLQSRFSQLLYDNYQQVEDDDVSAFCQKLVSDLQHLVQAAAADQAEDMQGLCALCGRDMPLTKHHLIPRDVHKEFKKRGFGFDQLQSGLLVCRPCHSAVHRAVPDNKELAMHYRTLDDLRQHEAIAKFSAWASKQRVSSKVDATAKHFRYRR